MIKHTVIKVDNYSRSPAFKWAIDKNGEPYVLTENSMQKTEYVSLIYDDEYNYKDDYEDDEDYCEETSENQHYTGIDVEPPMTWKKLFND